MDGLKWSPAFETGLAEIDDDHRNLFALAERIGADVAKGNAARCSALVQEFIDAAEMHFAREEEILVRVGFPDVVAHKVYHASLLSEAKQLRQVCDAETDHRKADTCYEALIAFLIDDVVRGDTQFKSYLGHYGFADRNPS